MGLRQCQRGQWDLAIISFSSPDIQTQRGVISGARALEQELIRPFVFVHTCNRKFLADPLARRPSLTGCSTCKAEEVNQRGAAVFVDDQAFLLREVESLQSGRARGNKARCLIAQRSRPSSALCELKDLFEEEPAVNFPLPSLLKSLA